MLTCNFVGVAFCRSLHFQFYTWYWHALPYLLWSAGARLPLLAKLGVLGALEYAWSYGLDKVVGTSTPLSSAALQAAHLVLLGAILFTPAQDPVFEEVKEEGGGTKRKEAEKGEGSSFAKKAN